MKPPPFAYARPATLSDAIELLTGDVEEVKVLGGGQSLIPVLNFRLAQPSLLVDVSRLSELSGISIQGDDLVIGAGVRQSAVLASREVRRACPVLVEALAHVGHPQTRNRGTFGGSLAHADAASELCAVVLALDARMVATGPAGERTIPAADFFLGVYTTALSEDEVLTRVHIPVTDGATARLTEFARRHGDFALAGAVSVLWSDPGAEVRDARLVGFGVATAPVRLPAGEEALVGRIASPDVAREAARAATETLDVLGTPDAPERFRRHVLQTLLYRQLSS